MHTGPLIMGVIGDEHRMDAATISDTVNTASRVESLTKYYGASILITQDSLNLVGQTDIFNLRYLGQVQVKGKHEPVGILECIDGICRNWRRRSWLPWGCSKKAWISTWPGISRAP